MLLDIVNVYNRCIMFLLLMDLVKGGMFDCVRFGFGFMFDRDEINCVGFFVDFLYLYLFFCNLVIWFFII